MDCLPEKSVLIPVLNQFLIENLKNLISPNIIANFLDKYYIFKSDREYFQTNWKIAFEPILRVLLIPLSKLDPNIFSSWFVSLVTFPLNCKKYALQFNAIKEIENFVKGIFQQSSQNFELVGRKILNDLKTIISLVIIKKRENFLIKLIFF